jgi:hypothetical protein
MWNQSPSRRRFLILTAAGLAAAAGRVGSAWGLPLAATGPKDHPTPRPGIDASRVLPDSSLAEYPDAIPAFQALREIPHIADGIRCQCGCATLPGFYSLLSCYEGEAMARFCDICQGEARLAHRLHRAGKTLDEIRHAIDVRYG